VITGRREARDLEGPLTAFDLKEAHVLRYSVVNDVSLKYLNSGMDFILAHELGHLFYRDQSLNGGPRSIAQEERADQFALDLLASIHEAPVGLVPFFSATRFNDPTLSAARTGTHALSYERLTKIADRLSSS
jgi:hypothetical protein